MNERNESYISRGLLRMEVLVIERTRNVVRYLMGSENDTVYERSPTDFDRIYRWAR